MPVVLTNIAAAAAEAFEVVAPIALEYGAPIAISAGLAAISSFLLKPSLGNQDQKQNIRQPTAARRRYYGPIGDARVYP